MRNTLYYGDHLSITREHIAHESVDLIYLDPPFNSACDYSMLLKHDRKGEHQARMIAVADTWRWHRRPLPCVSSWRTESAA